MAIEPWQRIVNVGAITQVEFWQRRWDVAGTPPTEMFQRRTVVAAGEPWQRSFVLAPGDRHEPYQRIDA